MPSVYQFRQAAIAFLLSPAGARLKNHFGLVPDIGSLKYIQVYDKYVFLFKNAGISSLLCLPFHLAGGLAAGWRAAYGASGGEKPVGLLRCGN